MLTHYSLLIPSSYLLMVTLEYSCYSTRPANIVPCYVFCSLLLQVVLFRATSIFICSPVTISMRILRPVYDPLQLFRFQPSDNVNNSVREYRANMSELLTTKLYMKSKSNSYRSHTIEQKILLQFLYRYIDYTLLPHCLCTQSQVMLLSMFVFMFKQITYMHIPTQISKL